MARSIAVLGIGRFGANIAHTVYDMGADLLVADYKREKVEYYSDKATVAVSGDLASPEFVESLDLGSMDVVVVCMSSRLEATLTCVVVAKEQGAPYVVAKVADDRTGRILERLGCDEIIQPEAEYAIDKARILMSDDLLKAFDMGDHLCMVEIVVKRQWVGKTLRELRLRKALHMTVVLAKVNGESMFLDSDDPITEDMVFLIVIDDRYLGKLAAIK